MNLQKARQPKPPLRWLVLFAILTLGAFSCATSSDQSETPTEEPTENVEPMQQPDDSTSEPAAEPQPEPAGLVPIEPDDTQAEMPAKAEIQAFVATYTEVQRVSDTYHRAISGAEDAEQAQALQQEASVAIEKTIVAGPLGPERFLELANLAEQDPKFAEEVRDVANEMAREQM